MVLHRNNRLATARFLFHSIAFSYFLRVWLWHFTDAASRLPGASGFGWFFRYLTFCSFTLQTCQLFVCTMDDLTVKVRCRSAAFAVSIVRQSNPDLVNSRTGLRLGIV
jgi:hypothetical protein